MATPNIQIANVERTQTIQYFNFPTGQGSGYAPDNSLPLVSRKPTILRVYVDTRNNDASLPVPTQVNGVIWLLNQTTLSFGVYNAINGPINSRGVDSINRLQANHTLNFVIPWEVCMNQVLCEIFVFDADDEFSMNMSRSFLTLDFVNVPPVNVHSVLIHYTGVDYFDKPVDKQTTGYNVLSALDYLLRTYPLSDFNFDGCEVLEWKDKLAIASNFLSLSAQLSSMRALSGTNDLYLGLIPPEAGCGGICGHGGPIGGGKALFFSDDTLDQNGAAHEVGHALGRIHAPGCLPASDPGDSNYPQYNSYPRASIGECGIDTRTLELFDPHDTSDYMSYCKRWASPYGWLQIKNILRSGVFSPTDSVGIGTSSLEGINEWDYLSFRIFRERQPGATRRVEFVAAFHIERTRPSDIDPGESKIMIELCDKEGNVINNLRCIPTSDRDENNVSFEEFMIFYPHSEKLGNIEDPK